MKKIFLVLLFLTSLFSFEEISWIHSFEEGKIEAKKKSKKILIFLTQEGCPTCEYMKDDAFEDEALIYYINDNFIPVLLDINKDTLPKGIKPKGTPTFLFAERDGEILRKRVYGGAKPAIFLETLKKIN